VTTLDTAPATTTLPKRADGIEFVGEFEGSGFKEPPSLVRRADGQVVQLPPLLYALLERLDGSHSADDIAKELGDSIGRKLTADNVEYLATEKLQPLGLVASADGSQPDVAAADPLLGLKFRFAVVPEGVSNALGATFQPLFFPPVVLAVLAGLVAADAWLFFGHGVAQSLRQAIYHPALFLPLFGLIVLSAAFHEIGHAAACRYGGGRPGRMGCGLYLAWPAFYTDVTDAYRLGRRSRLRTDLGGVYFNAVLILATVGVYFWTHYEPVLLLVLLEHFEIVHQLLPVVRLDGYYIVADLTGVPDLFARIGPILRSMVPGRPADDSVTALKRWVRVAVTAWVAIVVPLLALQLLMVLIHLPRIIGTAWDSGSKIYHSASGAFGDGDWVKAGIGILQLVVLSLPVLGIFLMMERMGVRGARWMWRSTTGRPISRVLALGVTGALLGALLLSWIPSDNYTPIRRNERGTVTQGIAAIRKLPTRHAPLESERTDTTEPTTTSTSTPASSDETTIVRRTTTTFGSRSQTPPTFSESPPTTVSGFVTPGDGNASP
jgi:putative peptide zinc metalloprotease protein